MLQQDEIQAQVQTINVKLNTITKDAHGIEFNEVDFETSHYSGDPTPVSIPSVDS